MLTFNINIIKKQMSDIYIYKGIFMDKTITRFNRTIKIFGVKIGETEERYESVRVENAEPFFPIITEYEMDNIKNENT